MGVMVLISCLKFDNLRGEKVERLLRVKDLGFFFFFGYSLALQIRIGCAKSVENGILYSEDMG